MNPFAFVLVVCLLVYAVPAEAAFSAGLRFGLEKSVGFIAGVGYKTNCKARDLDYKSDDSW
jgi:hypothetical protein